MIDKLVEEIANDFLDFEGLEIPKDAIPVICRAMRAYHEAKMKEVTDEDDLDMGDLGWPYDGSDDGER